MTFLHADFAPAPARFTPVDASWWRGAVIYQVYLRSFQDSNGDGIGDLPGLISKLPYIASLGADALWVSPFYASPQKDFGYDVADHCAVEPMFGTLEDVSELCARAHALGLRVMLDQVWSHTSNQHAWFRESRKDCTNPKADWYVWADPQPDGTAPNNWLSVFGGTAWTWEPRRRQYYLHHFLSEQPALNFHCPEVLDAVLEIGRFWLDRGVDGFRLDAVDWMLHDPQLRNNPPQPRAHPASLPAKLFGMQEHRYDVVQPGTVSVLTRIRTLMDGYPGTATLGEVSSQPGAMQRVLDYTTDNTRLHMAYTLHLLRGEFSHAALGAVIAQIAASGNDGWPCWSFSNHDAERAASRWNPCPGTPPDPTFCRLMSSFLLCLRGSVCLYQGEELGLTDGALTYEQMRDPFGLAFFPEFRGRDGSRTPMPWDGALPQAGFSTVPPWLPVPAEHHGCAVATQVPDTGSLLNHWRQMLHFRRSHPALVQGALVPITLAAPCLGFIRHHADDGVLCLFNLSATPQTLINPGGLDLGTFVLEPFGAHVAPL